ncbi:MAG: RsmE family RNA methyltransferase [Chitinophagaceae bacterium]
MALPFFYHPFSDSPKGELQLEEDSSRHIAQVLRMREGEQMMLTNGQGSRLTATLTESHKKHCRVQVNQEERVQANSHRLTLAVGMLKNASRMEWLLEKATEMGVHRIVPLETQRTIREKFRQDRMQGILISAMLQSQQCWLPILSAPTSYSTLWQQDFVAAADSRFIAHCLPAPKENWGSVAAQTSADTLLCIGPEGDFTESEIEEALAAGATAISLGENRLRTETAAMAAVACFYLING